MKPQTLDAKQDEQARLYRKYRSAKRVQWDELCASEPRLAGFRTAMRRINNGPALLVRLSDSWLRGASPDVRFAALQEIDRHSAKRARVEGREPLDDPMPPALNVLLAAKELLAIR